METNEFLVLLIETLALRTQSWITNRAKGALALGPQNLKDTKGPRVAWVTVGL